LAIALWRSASPDGRNSNCLLHPHRLSASTRLFFPALRTAGAERYGVPRHGFGLLAVHNGEQFIRKKLECLLALNYPAESMEILVVSDGSTDTTEAVVESFADRRVRLLRVPRGGKPAALNLALRHASGEILFFTDVRQSIHPDSLAHLVANFADPTVGAATGEPRFLDPDSTGVQADMEVYWRYELWVRQRHAEIDSACQYHGWIYALRRSLAKAIPDDTLTDDAVILWKLSFAVIA